MAMTARIPMADPSSADLPMARRLDGVRFADGCTCRDIKMSSRRSGHRSQNSGDGDRRGLGFGRGYTIFEDRAFFDDDFSECRHEVADLSTSSGSIRLMQRGFELYTEHLAIDRRSMGIELPPISLGRRGQPSISKKPG